jgi:hypothetical protein
MILFGEDRVLCERRDRYARAYAHPGYGRGDGRQLRNSGKVDQMLGRAEAVADIHDQIGSAGQKSAIGETAPCANGGLYVKRP